MAGGATPNGTCPRVPETPCHGSIHPIVNGGTVLPAMIYVKAVIIRGGCFYLPGQVMFPVCYAG
ncbi:hypothetical protein GTS_29180 [Gandjariella thermophila]|uniref:Uncharacterized protein n=1 Tax=Gandjariella thermophila TaxID=1931992 RepID=A0A4D4J3N2_9PSEU|nr:hypothetical protein GTS_29180 [Gandjariella thermophila]